MIPAPEDLYESKEDHSQPGCLSLFKWSCGVVTTSLAIGGLSLWLSLRQAETARHERHSAYLDQIAAINTHSTYNDFLRRFSESDDFGDYFRNRPEEFRGRLAIPKIPPPPLGGLPPQDATSQALEDGVYWARNTTLDGDRVLEAILTKKKELGR